MDRIERGEIAEAIADYAEDGVLEAIDAGEVGTILAGRFEGRDAVGNWIKQWFSSFEPGSYRFAVEDSVQRGDRVLLLLRHTARGEASGVNATLRLYHAFTVREDGLIRWHAFSGDRDRMLRTVGLERAEGR